LDRLRLAPAKFWERETQGKARLETD